VDANGNWKIVGRIKNLIILGSGHNIAPEPLEDEIMREVPGVSQAVLIGNGRGFLVALLTGKLNRETTQEALNRVNSGLPHYKQVRSFHIIEDVFTIENGMLTASGKLKRDVIAEHFRNEIDAMYESSRDQAAKTA
jgi:long-chain acyl-CoA synthetase